jgi:probable F420-dependent oxidoreductase
VDGQEGRRIGLNLMRTHELADGDIGGVLAAAKLADLAGVAEVHVSDHVAISASERENRDGFPYPLDYPWFEPIAMLAAIAATTSRVRLATNVLIAPARPAILLAKQLATLDALSAGRVSIGFGVGWQRAEFEALGVPFDTRLNSLDEAIEVCRLLWSTAPAEYTGSGFAFHDLWSLPFPVQGDRLPISLGIPLSTGNVERIVRTADGWFPPPRSAEQLASDLTRLRRACEQFGRDPGSLKITAPLSLAPVGVSFEATGFPDPVEECASLFEAGADVVLAHPLPYCQSLDELEGLVTRLVALT